MTRISNNMYNYDGYVYVPRSKDDATTGFILASLASSAIMGTLPLFNKPFIKQMKKEHLNNHLYRDSLFKSLDISGLKEKGVEIIHTQFSDADLLAKDAKQIIDRDIKAGLNACYIPTQKIVKLNTEKAAISGFHELGHAMNNLKGKLSNLLQKCRYPGYSLAALMGTVALFSTPKPKDAPKDFNDYIRDNCGKIAFIGMLPTVAEEALASHRGIKLARKSGLAEPLVKNLKKFYGKALLTYTGNAIATGLAVFAAAKITEHFTRPKKVSLQSPLIQPRFYQEG